MHLVDDLAHRPGLDTGLRLRLIAFAALCRADDAILVHAGKRILALDDPSMNTNDDLLEICLQGIAYCGFPRALHALFTLSPWLHARRGESDIGLAEPVAGGPAHFESIYGSSASKLRSKIRDVDPVFEELVIEVAYGRILARPGIDAKSRELLGVAGLSVLGHATQMLSHAFGARRHGANETEILEAVETVAQLWQDVAESGHRFFLEGKLRENGGN